MQEDQLLRTAVCGANFLDVFICIFVGGTLLQNVFQPRYSTWIYSTEIVGS